MKDAESLPHPVPPGNPGPALGWPKTGLMILVLLAFDQASKTLMLDLIFSPPRIIEVTSFFQLTPVWNRGVSFGLLASDNPLAPYLLAGFSAVVAAMMLWWLHKGASKLATIGLVLVISGAIGNGIDRLLYGAVVDFLDFYLGRSHFPAFNIADAAISIGVGLLIVESFLYKEDVSAQTNVGSAEKTKDGQDT